VQQGLQGLGGGLKDVDVVREARRVYDEGQKTAVRASAPCRGPCLPRARPARLLRGNYLL